jgi:lipid A 3-O-deacylase
MPWPKIFALSLISLITASPAMFAEGMGKAPAPLKDSILFHSGISGLFDNEKNPTLALEYRSGVSLLDLGLQPWMGAGWATDGAVFVAAGIARTWKLDGGCSLSAGFGPGYYDRHEGLDLGSRMEFYSFVEIERETFAGQSVILRLAHISNGGLADSNPGTELLSLGYSLRLP